MPGSTCNCNSPFLTTNYIIDTEAPDRVNKISVYDTFYHFIMFQVLNHTNVFSHFKKIEAENITHVFYIKMILSDFCSINKEKS